MGPSYGGDFPDPAIVMVGPTYWGYATGSAGLNLQVMGSTDLVHWGLVSDPVPVLPAWSEPGHTWAPGVVRLAAGFVMYYTVRDGPSGRQCIPVARSPTPQGPFTDASVAPFVCQRDHGGSIDPSPFLGPDGSLFLIWKSDDSVLGQPTQLWSERLSPDGRSLLGAPAALLTDTTAWQGGVVERPDMITLDGQSYLFYAANRWYSADAAMGYAICASPLGPCRDASLNGPWSASHGAATGPSGPSPFRAADGTPELTYHAWGASVGYDQGGGRSLWVDALGFAPGYRATASDGGVFAFGAATYLGSASTSHPVAPVVGLVPTTDGGGYWQVGADGGVYSFGTARFFGSAGALHLARPIVGMVPSPTDNGYALVGADGGMLTYGDFGFRGSAAGARSAAPIVGAATSGLLAGAGYWVAASDGRVYSFGSAPVLGSMPGTHLSSPIVAIAASPTGQGYWLAAADGAVFCCGTARCFGSLGGVRPRASIVAITPSTTGAGYWLVGADGGVLSFGDARFQGSLGSTRLVKPITGLSGAPGPLVMGGA